MSTQPTGYDPRLGGDRQPFRRTGAEPQLGGEQRIDLAILDHLSRGLWASVEELRRVARLIPPGWQGRYRDALVARLDLVDPDALLPEVKPWRGGRDQRVRIIDSLGIVGDASTVDTLVSLLDDPNAEVRQAAIAALGRLRAVSALPGLSALIRQPDRTSSDRIAAADALAQIAQPDAVPPLIEALDVTGKSFVQRRIVRALGCLGDARAVWPLVGMLRGGPDVRLRAEAARALGHIGDIRAVLYLREGVDDLNEDVRLACVGALARFEGAVARDGLAYALSDLSEHVRLAAGRALRRRTR
jgi:HEAT repeat protein